MLRLLPTSPLFPYTTLFRSLRRHCGLLSAAGAGGHCPDPLSAVHSWRAVHGAAPASVPSPALQEDRKSTRLNSSHVAISYAVFCLKKQKHVTRTIHNIS